MNKKIVIRSLIILAVVGLFVLLCVETFVGLRPAPKIYYDVNYEATEGGRVEGNVKQTVLKGKDCQTVTAIPDDGYRFLRWSDTSSPDPVRKDTKVKEHKKPQAKFVKISDIKFKILLIYVTEVQATFKDIDGNDVVADYKMTEEDLTVCRMTTELFDICLNETFNGLVTFQIDEYYTTEVMREENFDYRITNDGKVDTRLLAKNIPEVADMLKDYGCYITDVPLNDPKSALTDGMYNGSYDYGGTLSHYLDIPREIDENGNRIRRFDYLINDYSNYNWLHIMNSYMWEFITSIEWSVTAPTHTAYFWVEHEYIKNYTGRDPNRYTMSVSQLYLLNQAEYNGKTVGIPFQVWTNEIYELRYTCGRHGYVYSTVYGYYPQKRVVKGYNGEEVEAFANLGYRFVEWSDGVKTAKRIDKNIRADMVVTAIFEPIEFTFKYIATEGGRIEGRTEQTVLGSHNPGEYVTAVPENGYRFVGWSDGVTSARRTTDVHDGNINLVDENNCLVITAIFEKI